METPTAKTTTTTTTTKTAETTTTGTKISAMTTKTMITRKKAAVVLIVVASMTVATLPADPTTGAAAVARRVLLWATSTRWWRRISARVTLGGAAMRATESVNVSMTEPKVVAKLATTIAIRLAETELKVITAEMGMGMVEGNAREAKSGTAADQGQSHLVSGTGIVSAEVVAAGKKRRTKND